MIRKYRKQGRSSNSSNFQRSSSDSYTKGGDGTGPAPSLSTNHSASSFKKSNNAQGAQPKLSPTAPSPVQSAAAPSNPQSLHNAPMHGASDSPVISGVPKHPEPSAQQRSSPVVPKAPTSQHAPVSSDSTPSATPVKVPRDASKGAFPFQFGSLSPGLMNVMQTPARTSSATPNLDEQKRDKARHDTLRSVPHVPTPVPKQWQHKKDTIAVDKASTGDSQPIPMSRKETQCPPPPPVSQNQRPPARHDTLRSVPHVPTPVPKQWQRKKDTIVVDKASTGNSQPIPMSRKETQGPPPPPVSQNQRPPALPFSVNSMSIPCHQPQVVVQFGGPNPQIQPQGVPATSLRNQVPVSSIAVHVTVKRDAPSIIEKAVKPPPSNSSSKTGGELSRSKSTTSRMKKKKKRKEILLKADAAGTTSDFHMAYKGSEEKKENTITLDDPESTPSNSVEMQATSDKVQAYGIFVTKGKSNKTEPEDWEDAVDVSTWKLETSAGGVRDSTRLTPQDEDGNPNSAKKYSRDFLRKFSERCCDLPDGFEITSHNSDALKSTSVSASAASTTTATSRMKKKKKRKEILQKADAAGTTSDFHMAYNGPEDKKENTIALDAPESTPKDWEDAVDVSTAKLETSAGGVRDSTRLTPQDEDGNPNSAKKYSRDFLRKFSERCCDLPDGFEITSHNSNALKSNSVSASEASATTATDAAQGSL